MKYLKYKKKIWNKKGKRLKQKNKILLKKKPLNKAEEQKIEETPKTLEQKIEETSIIF